MSKAQALNDGAEGHSNENELPPPAYDQFRGDDLLPSYSGIAKEYGIYYPKISWSKDLHIRDDLSGRDAFFASVSEARHKPDLVLHETNSNGPILGTVDMRSGRSMHILLGPDSFETASKDQKMEMKHESKLFGTSKFILTIAEPDQPTATKAFAWQKKDYKKIDNLNKYEKKALTNYEIVDQSNEQVIAIYAEHLPQANLTERGKLRIPTKLSNKEHMCILLGTLALCERARRNVKVSDQGRGIGLGGFLGVSLAF